MSEELLNHDNYSVLYHEKEQIIEVLWKGILEQEVMAEFYSKTLPMLEKYRKVHYLNDYRLLDDIKIAARWTAVGKIKTQKPYIMRSAVFGLSPVYLWLFKNMKKMSGRDDIQVFSERAMAWAWLTEKPEN